LKKIEETEIDLLGGEETQLGEGLLF